MNMTVICTVEPVRMALVSITGKIPGDGPEAATEAAVIMAIAVMDAAAAAIDR